MQRGTKIKELIEAYNLVCEKIVIEFAKKQDIEFEFWVANDVGGVACFNSDYFFNMSDILLDLNTNQKKGFIIKWLEDEVEFGLKNPFNININYNSYIMGARQKDLCE